ncbi:tyrosine-type recombinase/integrase [Rhodanobacter hydrolyticus]|uniref:Integrase arm-type DNA-binding domain-containing protein n=1 Tax=Rhodanobacter hydrolyticus TaxID=2250595 RepID=A0ABW8J3K2_9GAMM
MGRPINRLSARQVATAKAGYHADGGGLYLQVTDAGTRSWVLRYQFKGRRREMGLGAVALVSLQDARHTALGHRQALLQGIDPLDARRAAQAVTGMTWGACVDAFIETHRHGWKNDAQAEQWEQSLKDYGPARDAEVARIDTPAVLACLHPIWTDKTETATRVRGRIERILDWARVSGYRSGENPARWRGHLDKLLPRPSKVKRAQHHAAMPYSDLPAFIPELLARRALAAKAMHFTLLTAARTGEVTGMPWAELDLDAGLWTIPVERMKGGAEHVVPLVPEAVAILKGLPRNKPPFPLSENAMLYLLQKRMGKPFTVHGFRSSFRDWAAEKTDFPAEVVEMALAHTIRNKVEAAYRRGALLEKRRKLMEAWAAYCETALQPSDRA